jgi:hypothetical protein
VEKGKAFLQPLVAGTALLPAHAGSSRLMQQVEGTLSVAGGAGTVWMLRFPVTAVAQPKPRRLTGLAVSRLAQSGRPTCNANVQ